MDDVSRKRLDSVLEDELRRGYRIKEVPAHVRTQLENECGLAIERVRFTRLNPAKRRKIAEVVQRQYHKDLRDESILSHEQIMKLVQERGEWTESLQKEMSDLNQSTNKEMGELFFDGLNRDTWTQDLLEASAGFRSVVTAAGDSSKLAGILERFDRWLEWSEEKQDIYTERYAAEQGKDRYSLDHDLQRLMEAVPDISAVDYLNTIDDLRDKLNRYLKLQRSRIRLAELQVRYAKIFSDSVEQRRDNAEEMARLYFTTDRVDADDKPIGAITDKFEALWDLPEAAVQWFLVEAYFFMNGIPDEAREYLETFGFLAAEPGEKISSNGESEPSDESPAPQSSSLDSDLVETTDSASSALELVTT
jgi:hypothetical protein